MRSYDGCWTCRLRRKKCDEEHPICRTCSTLQVTCYYSDTKPEWMDGGEKQKEMAEQLKHSVRRGGSRRRRIGVTQAPMVNSHDGRDLTYVPDTEYSASRQTSPSSQSELASTRDTTGELSGISSPCPTVSRALPMPGSSDTGNASTMPPGKFPGSSSTTHSWIGSDSLLTDTLPQHTAAGLEEVDRGYAMFYLDHFFPFLFPFYHPPLLEGGRSWVLELIVKNQAMWHTTLCLSAYFLSVALDSTDFGHEMCKTLAWDKLLRQADITFKMLQHDLQDISIRRGQEHLPESARIMGSVIQLQRFEISVGNFKNCHAHLNAALLLFRQILHIGCTEMDEMDEDVPLFSAILSRMDRPSYTWIPWSADQAAFRFFSALLIVDDIIASTCLEEPPRLREYHLQILTNSESPGREIPLNLEEFVGYQNWVILQIGEIAALDSWKKGLKREGKLDMMELVHRATTIKRAISDNLICFHAVPSIPKPNSPLDVFALYHSQLSSVPDSSAFITRVWAHAAQAYLSVVVSGWQPANPTIRENVERTLELLAQIPTPALFRAVAWPFCVVGCLAEQGQEAQLRGMIATLEPLRLFGTMQAALEIMENVWRNRDEVCPDEWDLAACFRSLGHMVLLV